MKGNTGSILHVDLDSGSISREHPQESFYRRYVGGACLGAYYLFKDTPHGVDPLGPDNVMVFSVSAVVGAPISGNARHCVTAKSPLTGGIASSEGGGYWGPELKFAGYDAIVIRGRSPKPVYLSIRDGVCELRDATALWGKVTGEVQELIRSELGDEKTRILQIGPAGESLVRFAAIVNDLKHFNGRAGLGAVMGSKNLRAIAVRGTTQPDFADRAAILELARRGAGKMTDGSWFRDFRRLGTIWNVTWNSDIGGLPTRNWTMGAFSGKGCIDQATYARTMMDEPGTCWACVQSCKRDLKPGLESPRKIETKYGGPEYETVGMLGSNCMVDDYHAIAKANEIASKYCMDTISLGGVIGFVMECYERGIVSTADLGFPAPFGDGDALVRLADITARRVGFGDAMAEGTAVLARRLGPEAEKLAVTVKGKEFPAHMPTSKGLMALAYAANPYGPDHMCSEHDGAFVSEPGEVLKGLGLSDSSPDTWRIDLTKAKAFAYTQRATSALDSLSVCHFCFNTWTIYSLTELVGLVNAATGWDFTMQEFMLLGERRVNLIRAYNAREGFTLRDDTLPRRLFEDPLIDAGIRTGATVDRASLEAALLEYYLINGWDRETGNPTPVKLRELGLEWVLSLP